jgi:proteasome lid subunit RPN8/RPN11
MEITSRHHSLLREAYEVAYPRECCGVLLGVRSPIGWVVRRVVETPNAVSVRGGFAIPDHELRRARCIAAEASMWIVAVFHSHPEGSTELSDSDRDALSYSEWPWVVLTQNRQTRELRLTWYNRPKGRQAFKNGQIETPSMNEKKVRAFATRESASAELKFIPTPPPRKAPNCRSVGPHNSCRCTREKP